MVQTIVGLVEVENVKSNTLLSSDISLNLDIRLFPNPFPSLCLFLSKILVAEIPNLLEDGKGLFF